MPEPNGDRTIGDFLRELVADRDRLIAYLYDEERRWSDLEFSGLSEEDKAILLQGELDELCVALQSEADADVRFHIIIRPPPPPPPD